MSWWPWSDKPGEASSSRSNMRDAMNRLRSILIKSGLEAEDEEMKNQSTGDPFQDKVNLFTRTVKTCRDQIVERNKNQRESMGSAADLAMDSHEVNRSLKDLRVQLDELKVLMQQDEDALRKANKKGKEQDKIDSLERAYKEKTNSYQNCTNALESLQEINAQRMMGDKEVEGGGGRLGTSIPKGFRTSIDVLKQRRKNHRISVGADDGKQSDLATNEETKEEFAMIKEKQKKQDQALMQLGNVLGEIQEGAKKIGQELDKQNKMLEDQTTKVDSLTDKVQNLNKGLTDLLKKQKPISMTIYCVGCLLILAIVGFFVFEFGLA